MKLADGIRLEQEFANALGSSEDAKEGPMAFAQKRKPEYKGR